MKVSLNWSSKLRAGSTVLKFLAAAATAGLAISLAAQVAGGPKAGASRAGEGGDKQHPVVPPILEPPADQKVAYHAYAEGVQIYVCRNVGTTEAPQYAWVFVAPEAVLYMSEDGEKREKWHLVGLHCAGPTWEYKDGSKVVGKVLQRADSPKAGAVPWLLLQAIRHDGKGRFAAVTYIQRVDTDGGGAPTTGADAAHEGQEVRVPYSADYYLYRKVR
jgi:hypothetical protein